MRISITLMLVIATAITTDTHADPMFATDGWHTWQVSAVANSPDWCCYEWRGRQPNKIACDLDAKRFGFSSSDTHENDSGRLQIYALIENGSIRTARALNPTCPVKSRGAIVDMGDVETATSVAWLLPPRDLSHREFADRLAAIAVHRGPDAQQFLESTADSRQSLEKRKAAVFWLGQARLAQGGTVLRRIMVGDSNIELRKHAAFSYAQSNAADREDVLIALVENQQLSNEDRKNALFWLAQTESNDAIDYIQQLLLR